MLIDWLTLRLPISGLTAGQIDQLMPYIGAVYVYGSDGQEVSKKPIFDVDKLRTDSKGIFWRIDSDGKERYLTVGASPSAIEHGNNVFGSADIRHCAEVLIGEASRVLGMFLPPPSAWRCTRIDYTHNYALQSNKHVKQALRELLKGDGFRQKAVNNGGDSVYWGIRSDLISGKAYDKGSQLQVMVRRGKATATAEQLELASRLLRFELSLKSRWFRRFYDQAQLDGHPDPFSKWLDITPDFLMDEHTKYFGKFIGDSGVMEMNDKGRGLLQRLEFVTGTKGRAQAAFDCWMRIRQLGYEVARETMPERTWRRHIKALRDSGLSEADLQSAIVIPFRRNVITLSNPVTSWDELRRAA